MRKLAGVFMGAISLAGIFGVVQSASAGIRDGAQVALCVGCTAESSFEGAAWQALGTNWIGEREALVVNPDTGLAKWVFLVHYPSGVDIRAVRPNGTATVPSIVPIDTAIGLESDPFSAIYLADGAQVRTSASGVSNASAMAVSSDEQIAINVAIAVTRKTYFVRLDPSIYPSYGVSEDWQIANQNWVALQNAGIGWPVTAMGNKWWSALVKTLGLYTGHTFVVCDIFGNGDVACFVPDPIDKNITQQDGSAKDVDKNELPDITNRVAGGGGGAEVVRSTGRVTYWPPSSVSGGGGGIVCGYVDGSIVSCIKQN